MKFLICKASDAECIKNKRMLNFLCNFSFIHVFFKTYNFQSKFLQRNSLHSVDN